MFHPAGTSQLSPRSSGYWLSRRVYFRPLQVPSTTAFPISSRLQMRQEFSADVQKSTEGIRGGTRGPMQRPFSRCRRPGESLRCTTQEGEWAWQLVTRFALALSG